jgi:hypothetical protein
MTSLTPTVRAELARRSANLYASGLTIEEVAAAISAGADGKPARASSVTGVRRWLADAGMPLRPKGHAGRRIRLAQAAGEPYRPVTPGHELARMFFEIGWVGGVVIAVRLRGHLPVTGEQVRRAVGAAGGTVVQQTNRRYRCPHPAMTQEEFDRLHAPWPLPAVRTYGRRGATA